MYGLEFIGGEWWSLWCSEECARVQRPEMDDVEWFASLRFFGDHLGWSPEEMTRHRLKCSSCEKALN